MPVEDKYVNSTVAADKKISSVFAAGDNEVTLIETVEIAAADDDGSIYRFFRSVPANYIPVEINIYCDAITAGTDYDLGLYKTNLGVVVDRDALMDGQTLATALTRATGHNLGLGAVNVDGVKRTLASLSGQTNPDPSYDIALTGVTVGTAAGTVSIVARFVQG
jgi:hypothetical protein